MCQGGFPGGSVVKESACQCKRRRRCLFDPWLGISPGGDAMAIHPSVLAWEIPWTEEPCGL